MQACKVMAQTLRYIAHAHGAHLVYTGGLHAVPKSGDLAAQRAAALEAAMLDSFKALLTHLMFSGLDKKLCASHSPLSNADGRA